MRLTRRKAIVLAAGAPFALAASAEETSRIFDGIEDDIEKTELAAKNVAIIRTQNDALNKGDINGAVQYLAEDTRNHGVPVGRKGLVRVLTDIIGTFPDWNLQIEDTAAIGDEVIIRCIATGTHKGVGKIPVNGGLLVGVPPTGKRFKVQHIHWYTLKDGLIVEHRANRDDLGMMQQLGLLPAVKRYDLPDPSK
jgi:predicted ester cyclase